MFNKRNRDDNNSQASEEVQVPYGGIQLSPMSEKQPYKLATLAELTTEFEKFAAKKVKPNPDGFKDIGKLPLDPLFPVSPLKSLVGSPDRVIINSLHHVSDGTLSEGSVKEGGTLMKKVVEDACVGTEPVQMVDKACGRDACMALVLYQPDIVREITRQWAMKQPKQQVIRLHPTVGGKAPKNMVVRYYCMHCLDGHCASVKVYKCNHLVCMSCIQDNKYAASCVHPLCRAAPLNKWYVHIMNRKDETLSSDDESNTTDDDNDDDEEEEVQPPPRKRPRKQLATKAARKCGSGLAGYNELRRAEVKQERQRERPRALQRGKIVSIPWWIKMGAPIKNAGALQKYLMKDSKYRSMPLGGKWIPKTAVLVEYDTGCYESLMVLDAWRKASRYVVELFHNKYHPNSECTYPQCTYGINCKYCKQKNKLIRDLDAIIIAEQNN